MQSPARVTLRVTRSGLSEGSGRDVQDEGGDGR